MRSSTVAPRPHLAPGRALSAHNDLSPRSVMFPQKVFAVFVLVSVIATMTTAMDRPLRFHEDVYDLSPLYMVDVNTLMQRFVLIYERHYAQCAPGIRHGCDHVRFVLRA